MPLHTFRPQYVINCSVTPRSCFPVGYDTSDLVDVTQVTDMWRRYVKRSTGEEVDCAKFAAMAEEDALDSLMQARREEWRMQT